MQNVELVESHQPDWTPEQIDLITRTIAPGCSADELALFLYTAKRCGLDPMARQIHAVKRWDNKEKREKMTIQVSVDGYRLIADRTGQYAGSDDAVFAEKDGKPIAATVTVYKVVSGIRCPFTATARWSEYVQTYKDKQTGQQVTGGLWAKMPHTMLAKCAETLALRKAFPADLSGTYSDVEMQQADGMADAGPATIAPTQRAELPAPVQAAPFDPVPALAALWVPEADREKALAKIGPTVDRAAMAALYSSGHRWDRASGKLVDLPYEPAVIRAFEAVGINSLEALDLAACDIDPDKPEADLAALKRDGYKWNGSKFTKGGQAE